MYLHTLQSLFFNPHQTNCEWKQIFTPPFPIAMDTIIPLTQGYIAYHHSNSYLVYIHTNNNNSIDYITVDEFESIQKVVHVKNKLFFLANKTEFVEFDLESKKKVNQIQSKSFLNDFIYHEELDEFIFIDSFQSIYILSLDKNSSQVPTITTATTATTTNTLKKIKHLKFSNTITKPMNHYKWKCFSTKTTLMQQHSTFKQLFSLERSNVFAVTLNEYPSFQLFDMKNSGKYITTITCGMDRIVEFEKECANGPMLFHLQKNHFPYLTSTTTTTTSTQDETWQVEVINHKPMHQQLLDQNNKPSMITIQCIQQDVNNSNFLIVQLSNGYVLHINLFNQQIVHLFKLEDKIMSFVQIPMQCYETWILIPQSNQMGYTLLNWSQRNHPWIIKTNSRNRILMTSDRYWTMGDNSSQKNEKLKPYQFPFLFHGIVYDSLRHALLMIKWDGTLHHLSLL